MMLVIWILSVVVIPRASVIIAGRGVNVPSVDEINSKKSKFSQQLFEEQFKKMSSFTYSGDDNNRMQEFQKQLSSLQEESNKNTLSFAAKLNEERSNKQKLQQDLAFGISRISPSACFSLAATNVAGTSLNLSQEFIEQAVAYQDVFKKFQVSKTGATTGGGVIMFTRRAGEEEKKIDTKELPKFNFNPPEFNKVIGKSIIDLAILIIYNLIFFFGSFVAFLKYDLR
jgi:ABC-type transport system involved in multi-copper enzyme maturation permease subunit